MKRFRFDWLVYLIVGVILIIGAILFLLPFKEQATTFVRIVVGIIIILYAAGFLFPHIVAVVKDNNSVLTDFLLLQVVELVLVVVLAVLLITTETGIRVNHALAACLYGRGFVEIIRGYHSIGDIKIEGTKKVNYTAKYINMGLLTIGTWVFIGGGIFDEENIIYVFCLILAILGILCLSIGIMFYIEYRRTCPAKVKKENHKKIEPVKSATKPIESKPGYQQRPGSSSNKQNDNSANQSK